MAELMFVGVPAFVGRIDGQQQCAFWSESQSNFTYNPERLIRVDLSKHTKAISPTNWAQVQVDTNYLEGGLTTIGKTFNDGVYVGAVYIPVALFNANKPLMTWPPRPNERDYQYTSIARSDATGAIKRWSGFKAEVLQVNPPFVRVKIYETGDLVGKGPFWIDPSDPEVCDASNTKISTASPVGTQDALFLTWKYANTLNVNIPKLPPGAGVMQIPGLDLLTNPTSHGMDLSTLLTAKANAYGL